MDSLGESIVRKLALNFKGQAKDEASQRIIAEEVMKFIRTNEGVEEEDVAYLEAQIRHRLAGKGLTGRGEKLAAKQALMKSDDWSKVFGYMSHLVKEEAKQKALEQQSKKLHTRKALDAQVAEAAERVQAEEVQKKVDHVQQERELESWQKSEDDRRKELKMGMDKLKQERQAQLEEQARRKEIAAALKKKGEEEMTVRIALELKRQMEAEAASKAKAKEDLKAFLLSNEMNQKVKEEERRKEFADDIRFMREFSETLDKQERERLRQLDRAKAVQARQAEDAKQRPPVKRWVDPAIIEKQFEERQAALAAEEARRKAAVADRTQQFKAGVAAQLAEKHSQKLAQLEQQRKELIQSMEEVQLCKKMEQDAKQRELQKMRQFKADLEKQIAEDKAKREQSTMSETERQLNSKLLREIDQLDMIKAVKM